MIRYILPPCISTQLFKDLKLVVFSVFLLTLPFKSHATKKKSRFRRVPESVASRSANPFPIRQTRKLLVCLVCLPGSKWTTLKPVVRVHLIKGEFMSVDMKYETWPESSSNGDEIAILKCLYHPCLEGKCFFVYIRPTELINTWKERRNTCSAEDCRYLQITAVSIWQWQSHYFFHKCCTI